MTANKRASRRSLKSDLTRVDAHVVQASEYEELPEFTNDMLARATVNKGGRPASPKPRKLLLMRLPADLIERAAEVSGEQTKKAAVTNALQEFIARREQRRVVELTGTLDLDDAFNDKAERSRK